MTEQTWNLQVDGRDHRVDAVHGYWSARRQVAVDGREVMLIRPANPLQQLLWWALPTDHPFPISGHEALLRVIPDLARNSYRLTLALDGKWVDSGDAVEPIPGPFGISVSPESPNPLRETLLAAGLFLVGGAAILAVASSNWEDLPSGRPYVIGFLISLAYATTGGAFLAIASEIMRRTQPFRKAVIPGLAAALILTATLMYATPVVADPIRSLIGDRLAAAFIAIGIRLVILGSVMSFLGAIGVLWSLLLAPRRFVLARLARVLLPALGALALIVAARGPADWRPYPQAESFEMAFVLSIVVAGISYLIVRQPAEEAAVRTG